MAFSQSFTGKDTAVRLEGGGTQAQQGMSQMILDAEKLRYDVYQKNRSEFLKNANIDPAFVLSDSARKTQMLQIEAFNKKWGKRAQETNYNLSQQDLLDMQTHKNLIISEQQNQMSQYELFQQHRDLVAKNPNRYDVNKFAEATDSYMQSGVYDQTMPPLKAISFGSFIREQASKAKGEFEPIREIVGGREGIKTRNIQDIPKFIEDNLFVNDQATIGLLEDWDKQSPEEKNKWLSDVNQDKQIDASERKNGIVNWAKQFYAKDAEISSYSWRNVPTGKASTTGSTTSKIPEGKFVAKRPYGTKEYNNSYEFDGSKILRNVSTSGAVGISGDYEDALASGNVSGRLLLYNPDKDVLVFETVGSSESAETKGTTLVEVPAGNISGVDDIPITINGAKGTVGELRARRQRQQSTPTQPTQEPNAWDKYKRK